jgi:hypothetical protein
MVVEGETRVRPTDRSADGLGIETGDLFLESSRICPTLSSPRERLPRTASHEHVCRVYQVSPAGCTSI